MVAWSRAYPGVSRLAAVGIGMILTTIAAAYFHYPIDWFTAVAYGTALAFGMSWPIIMPGTGIRVVLLTGLLLEAVWRVGLATGFILLLVDFGLRLVVLYRNHYFWEWYRPVNSALSLAAAYVTAVVVAGGEEALRASHWFDSASFTLVLGYWIYLVGGWTLVRARHRLGIGRDQYLHSVRQTWWVPLLFLIVGWVMGYVQTIDYPLELVVCLVLIWIQYQIGPVFTTLHQDWAVSGLVRSAPPLSPAQRLTSQRVLQIAHYLARAAYLSSTETRLIGYAALLQDPSPDDGARAPLWLPHPPTPGQAASMQAHVEKAVRRVEADGTLREVAHLIQHRLAAYDGSGCPPVSGDEIPIGSQVLTAANALHVLTSPEDGSEPMTMPHAVDWLLSNASSQFSPVVLAAMSNVYWPQETPEDLQGLPETVHQLKGLVTTTDRSSLRVGLRRLWLQIRGKVGFVHSLPPEVQAVARMATFLASSTDVDRTAQITAEAVGRLLDAKTFIAIRAGDSESIHMVFRASYGFTHVDLVGRSATILGGHMSRAILNQTPVQVADMGEMTGSMADEIARTEGIRSVLLVPLVARGQTIGLLWIGSQAYHWFTPREVGLIHLMAGQAAVALENGRLIAEAADRLEHISNLKNFTDTLLDNLSTSILVVDSEGQLKVANETARARFGESLELEIGQVLPDQLFKAFRVDRVLGGHTVPAEDLVWESHILEAEAIPLQDQQGILLGAICLARDVTRVRRMEQQVRRVEKLAAIGELAAGAAHEIRNPLTSIRGFMQLLQTRAATSDGHFFQIIIKEIDRIDEIIHDLLLLARPVEPQQVEISLPALLDELLMIHQTELSGQQIHVVRHWDGTVDQIRVDPKLFRQVLLNLLRNALQAMPQGGTLRLSLRSGPAGEVILEVSDNGVGISSENLERLFVPFFTTKEEGTGLGLAICHNIVQAHQGHIDVQSEIGVGSTFRITLPKV